MQKKKGISLIVLVITYAIDEYGYQINNADYVSVTSDGLYVPAIVGSGEYDFSLTK